MIHKGPSPPPAGRARLGALGGTAVYSADEGQRFLLRAPGGDWRCIESLPALIREADVRIRALERARLTLIAVLAALPLMLMAFGVMLTSRPVSPPGLTLSLAAALAGCLLTGALIALGAWITNALLGAAGVSRRAWSPDPDAAREGHH